MKYVNHLFFLALSVMLFSGYHLKSKQKKDLRINDIQVIGSHNSYKQKIEPALLTMIQQETSRTFEELQYGHVSLTEQLDKYGLRNLEIDVVYDPKGRRYSKPLGNELLKKHGLKPVAYDPDSLMKLPGFKVMHVPDIDFRSNCLTLTSALKEIKKWSDAHPRHLPVCITMNTKSEEIEKPGFVKLLPFTETTFDSLETEISSVIPLDQIIKPDDVHADFKTLEEAVLANNWPKIEDARGKFLFVLDEQGQKLKTYTKGHPSLKNRLMFVSVRPGNPEAAFMIINNPVIKQENIKNLVRKGYLVRTRADADTREARKGDDTRFRVALSSGAHFISTDYYKADKDLETGYRISLPDGEIARCNPVRVLSDYPKKLE